MGHEDLIPTYPSVIPTSRFFGKATKCPDFQERIKILKFSLDESQMLS